MKKRKWICLAVSFLVIVTLFAGAFAAEESITEESITEESITEESITDETEMDMGLTAQDVTEYLEGIDYDELEKDLTAILAVVESEDFQHLMSYQEMQDLVIVLLDRMEDFAIEDPDLVAKICVALGLQEKFARLIPPLIKEYDYSKEDLEALILGDESRERQSVAMILLQHPEIAALVSQILETITGAAG